MSFTKILPGYFLSQIKNKLFINNSLIEDHKLIQDIKDKNECTLLNPLIDKFKFNEYLKYSPFIINNIIISKLYLCFNNNLDSSIEISDITIDLIENKNINENININNKNEKNNEEVYPKMITNYLNNLEIKINNIRIRFIEKDSDNILYSLFISEFNFKNKSDDNNNNNNNAKTSNKNANYFNSKNKIIDIGRIVIKEGYNENDEIFFNTNELYNKVNFYTNPKILLVIYNKIKLYIQHDYYNQKLLINSDNNDIFMESIMNITQILNLLQFKKKYLNNFPKEKNHKDKKEKKENKDKKEKKENKDKKDDNCILNIFGFNIKKFEINININYTYFIFLNTEENINKFWMFYRNYFDKYYSLNTDKKKNTIQNNNILSLIQKHFCYFESEYYLIYINQPKISLTNINNNYFKIISSSVISRLIQPNKISEKINVIIIDNKSNNNINDSNIDNEQSFNNLFLPYYKKVIQYGYYIHNISTCSNLEINNTEFNFNEIDFEINSFVIYNIYNYYKIIFMNRIDNEVENENVINEENDDKNYEFNYMIKGKRINLNLMINKKWIEYIRDKKTLNCFDSNYYSEKVYISFENIQFIINQNYQKILFNLYSNKIYLFYIMKNIIYPLVYIINTNNKINNIIISKLNNTNAINDDIESNYKYIINSEKINFFINPILITYYCFLYTKLFLYTFDIFKLNKNKIKNNIEENLNIDDISSQYELINPNFFKNFSKILKITEIFFSEINFIFFCHLSINNNKFDIKNIFEKNEYIFKLILNPILVLKLKELSYKNNKIKLNNILLYTKKKMENFNREDLIYKGIIGPIDTNSENCEFIIYKSKTNSYIIKGEVKIEEKKKNMKLDLMMDDIVFCPITYSFNEIVSNIEKNIIKYTKMNSYLFKYFPLINENIDIINYEKNFNNYKTYNTNKNNEIKYTIKLKCNKLLLDLYSTSKIKILYDSNLFENIFEKNKMRLILEFSQITMEYIYNQNLMISLQKINSAFLKDLRISHTSYCLLIDEYSIIDYSLEPKSNGNSTNSLYYLNIEEGKNKINRKVSIKNKNKNKHYGSIIANSGFVPILECEKGIIININLLINSKNDNNIGINTNNELIINDINIKFCKDSLMDIIYFIKKIPNEIQAIINLKNSFKDDFEKIIIEKDDLSINNLKEQLKIEIDTISSKEFHSVKTTVKRNSSTMYDKLLNPFSENNLDNNINANINTNISSKNIIEKKHQEKSKNKNKRKNYKLNINIININIYLYDGEDFNFQGNHTLVVFSNSPKTDTQSIQDNVIKINERNINNNILLNIKDFQCKYFQKNNDVDLNLQIKSLIIEDNIKISLYKKLLSHYDFKNNENIFFIVKIKLYKENSDNDSNNIYINAIFDITPISIYLDKNTFDYILHYFNIIKYIIKNENEENDEYEIYSHETNKKLNNRIIKNNDDIMNISNDEKNSNSNSNNNELITEEISSFNQLQNDNFLKAILNLDKLYIKELIINNFFIAFTYNSNIGNNNIEEEIETIIKDNENNNNSSIDNKLKYIEYLKNISLNEFVINFKKYDNQEKNKLIQIKNIFKELFDFYYNDIIDYKSFNNYVKALPVVNKVCNVFDGLINLWDKTVNHEKNNKTIKEGFVLGTQDLVVNTTCSILSIGEAISEYFNKWFFGNENWNNSNNRDKEGIIKIMKKQINEDLYEKEEYYYK